MFALYAAVRKASALGRHRTFGTFRPEAEVAATGMRKLKSIEVRGAVRFHRAAQSLNSGSLLSRTRQIGNEGSK